MEQQGLWALFWATGLPEAWLETRRGEEEARGPEEVPCAAPAEEADGL